MGQLVDCEIVSRQHLDDDELSQIWKLKSACEEQEGISIRLSPMVLHKDLDHGVTLLLCQINGLLAGVLWLRTFGGSIGELTGMVHPAYRRSGVFTDLLHEAMTECEKAGIRKVEGITDRASASGRGFLAAAGATCEHSEYRMEWRPADPPGVPARQVTLAQAGPADVDALAQIDARCFDLPFTVEDHAELIGADISNSNYMPLFALLDGKRIGKISLWVGAGPYLIYGFCVLPEHRGQGHGRDILLQCIELLRSRGGSSIELEVGSDNTSAIGLYRSCGFRKTATYDYYELPAKPHTPLVKETESTV